MEIQTGVSRCRLAHWLRAHHRLNLSQMLKLAPEDFQASALLKEWVSRNKNHKYVPLDLLEAWGFSVDLSL